MVAIYEFEVFAESDGYVSAAFDWDGVTQGDSIREAYEMTGDLLRREMEYRLIHNIDLPSPSFGHEPQHGGRIVAFAVEVSKDHIAKVTASEAARRLGLTPGRITQMLDANQLEGYREGKRTWVTLDSLNAQLLARKNSSPVLQLNTL